jgi:hypothetical protein
MLHKILNNWTLYIPYTFIGDLYGNQFASQHPIWLPLDLFRVYNNSLLCIRLRFAIPNLRTIHFSAKVGFLCIKIIVQIFFSSFHVHLCYNSPSHPSHGSNDQAQCFCVCEILHIFNLKMVGLNLQELFHLLGLIKAI